jgi:hypothetical protein
VTFESGIRLRKIAKSTFNGCLRLKAMIVSASVERLCSLCFCACYSLSDLRFESGSRLQCIEELALCDCFDLASLSLPASIQNISPDWLQERGGDRRRLPHNLRCLIFESGESFWHLVEGPEQDTLKDVKIYVPCTDRDLVYRSYSPRDDCEVPGYVCLAGNWSR